MAAGLLAGLVVSIAPVQAKPQRIVSLNLCADQLLLALADPAQIASLSPLARDPSLSPLAERAAEVPVNSGRGEAILLGGADLVLAGRYGGQARRELLARQGLDVIVLDPWESIAQGREQIRAVARRIGHPARGETLIAAIDAALDRSRELVAGRSVLALYRRGYVPAARSLVNDLLRHLGFTLQQQRLGLAEGGVAPLEAIVAAPPDYALMDEITGAAIDNGSAFLVHPALAAAIPPQRRLVVPHRLTLCGGPSTPAAIDALAAQVKTQVNE